MEKWALLALGAQMDQQVKMANWVTRGHLDSLESQVRRVITGTVGPQG